MSPLIKYILLFLNLCAIYSCDSKEHLHCLYQEIDFRNASALNESLLNDLTYINKHLKWRPDAVYAESSYFLAALYTEREQYNEAVVYARQSYDYLKKNRFTPSGYTKRFPDHYSLSSYNSILYATCLMKSNKFIEAKEVLHYHSNYYPERHWCGTGARSYREQVCVLNESIHQGLIDQRHIEF